MINPEFQKTLTLVIKHWPFANGAEDTLVKKIAYMATVSRADEKEIETICGLISDINDAAFQRGIGAANESY